MVQQLSRHERLVHINVVRFMTSAIQGGRQEQKEE